MDLYAPSVDYETISSHPDSFNFQAKTANFLPFNRNNNTPLISYGLYVEGNAVPDQRLVLNIGSPVKEIRGYQITVNFFGGIYQGTFQSPDDTVSNPEKDAAILQVEMPLDIRATRHLVVTALEKPQVSASNGL